MLLRVAAQQRTRMAMMATSRIQASRGTVLFSTNAAEVVDDEANRQQLDQISKQMEDAIEKEKKITESEQVTITDNMWDSEQGSPKNPSDPRIDQSSSEETMSSILKEQETQINTGIVDPPISRNQFQTKLTENKPWTQPTEPPTPRDPPLGPNPKKHEARPFMDIENPAISMMEQAKEVMMGTSNILKGTAKVAMEGVKGMADGVLRATGNTPSGGQENQEQEREQRERERESRRQDQEEGDDPSWGRDKDKDNERNRDPNARVKEYSEHRQNASLL